MGLFKSAAKTGIALKIMEMVRREAAKPQNQAKARQLITRATSRSSGTRAAGRQTGRRGAGNRWTTGR